MVDLNVSRRFVMAGAAGIGIAAAASPAFANWPGKPALREPLQFMAAMLQGDRSEPDLPQSHADELGLFSTAFIYDSALAVCAALSAGQFDMARRIGDGILFAQQNDPDHDDGRLRQGYNVAPYVFYDGVPNPWGLRREDGKANVGWQFGFLGTAVGDMAWPAIALTQLFHRTGERKYLVGAQRIGDWIIDHATSDGVLGGFSFGVDGANNRVPNVSTEHNVDCIALYRMLNEVDPDPRWSAAQRRAQGFVDRMWEPTIGCFYTGSDDGDTINRWPLPLDPQTWGWLAMGDERASRALEWAASELAVRDTPDGLNSQLPRGLEISGVTFSSASPLSTASYEGIPVAPQGVWLEGTAQLACAFNDRSLPRDRARAVHLLREVDTARRHLGAGQHVGGVPVSGGVVAASSLIDTGFGFGYFQVQHVGASAWAIMAERRANPMRLGRL